MSTIGVVDLSTFCGTIGTLYRRHGLCPPFSLYYAAQGWIARGIPLTHCVDVIERYLSRHGGNCYSGSGDRNLAWLSGLIERSWHDRSFARPPGPAPQQSRHDNWGDSYASEEPNQRSRRRENLTAAPKLDSKHDSFQPDKIPVRQKAAGAVSPVGDTRSVSPQKIHPKRSVSKSSGQMPAPGPKKIDTAVAWLRAELANGERPAAEVEVKALCVGISLRTLDRARQRVGVTSRRIGFGRWAKYLIALPTVHGTPKASSIDAGAT